MSLDLPAANLLPVDWGTIDTACYDWLNDLLSFSDRIIWENQKVAQPAYPYLSLLRHTEVDEGIDEKRVRTLDVDDKIVGEDDTAGDPVINEILTYQPITWTLSIQAHSDVTGGGNDPNNDAMKVLGKVKRSLGQRTIIDTLGAAGVSIVRPQGPTDLSAVINGEWISKANLDVIFRTASVLTERVGFIDKVNITSDSFPLDVDFTVDAS